MPSPAINTAALSSRLLSRATMDQTVKYGRITCQIGVVLALVALGAGLVINPLNSDQMLSDLRAHTDSFSSAPEVQLKSARAPADLELIEQKAIFGALAERTAPVKQETTKPIPPIPLDLVGTFISTGEKPYAIIEDRNKRIQDIFMIGEAIFDGPKLISISSDSVEIDRNGQRETLTIDLVSKSGGGGDSATSGLTGESMEITEADLNKALENLPLLGSQARSVPYFKDGQPAGLRLFAIKPGSFYEKIGLKNSDILKSINGQQFTDLTQTIKILEQLRDQRSITLIVERAKEQKELRYQIK